MKNIVKRIIPDFMRQQLKDYIKQNLKSYAEEDSSLYKENPLPFLLDSQINRLLYTLFRPDPADAFGRNRYVVELFKDLSEKHKLIKKAVVKYSVYHVCIETSSYCNRKCQYCHLSLLDRSDKNDKMPISLFARVIDSLAEIGFDKRFSFNLFNEPLSDKEHILECINIVRSKLPNSYQVLTSNGDFLTPDYLNALLNSRINELVISVHYDGMFNKDAQIKKCLSIIKRLGIKEKYDYQDIGAGFILVMDKSVYNSKYTKYLALRSEDFEVQGSDRAGVLDKYVRKVPANSVCPGVMHSINISHDGQLLPCCIMCSDADSLKPHIYGTVGNDGDIFDIFTNAKASLWRKRLFAPQDDIALRPDPCKFCGSLSAMTQEDCDRKFVLRTLLNKL